MGDVRAVSVSVVVVNVTVRSDMMRHIFMYWSNVLADLVTRAVAGRRKHGVVLRQAFVVC